MTSTFATSPAPVSATNRPPAAGRWLSGLFAVVCVTLIVLNLWWLWRESRPTMSIARIRTLIAAKQTEEAKHRLREILRRSPHDGEARMELARVLASEKNYEACARELNKVPLWWPTKAEAAFLEGQSLKFLDRMREAEAAWRVCNSYDQLHPTPPKYESAANMELMELFAYEERWDEAHKTIWNAYEHAAPIDHAAILVMRIRTEMERITPESAAVRLRKYVEADPKDWEARLALARAEQSLSRPEIANALIKQCLDERPEETRAWRVWLEILHAQGDLAGLSTVLAKLPKGAESDPEIWKFRALASEKSQDWASASSSYREALRLKPNDAELHYKLSVAEERLGHRDVALDHRKRNQALRAARGQLTEAFDKYLEADKGKPGAPDRKQAILRLASICAELGWERVAQGWLDLAQLVG